MMLTLLPLLSVLRNVENWFLVSEQINEQTSFEIIAYNFLLLILSPSCGVDSQLIFSSILGKFRFV